MPSVKTTETWHALATDHIEFIGKLARQRGPGRYTLREIYGDQWQFVRRARRFGLLFKRAVVAGALAGIRWIGRKSNRSQLYEVLS